jgi:hypothetical protein
MERSVRVGVLVLEVYVHGGSSLKEKRRVLRSLTDRCRQRLNVSVSEVDHQELHQRGTLAFAAVATSESGVQRILDAVVELAESVAPGSISEVGRDIVG